MNGLVSVSYEEARREYFEEQMKKAECVTEELKEENQLEWVCRMGNIEQRAREIVCDNLIYT